jgi:hypothetical protein
MRKIIFILLLATLSIIACKKESIETEVKTTPEIIFAPNPYCTGNNWLYDQLFYGRYYNWPLVYNNKAYVFKHNTDRVLIYNGTSWDSISSPIPGASSSS